MMKKININYIPFFFLITIITIILKYPYLHDVVQQNNSYHNLFIFYCNNTYINIVWFIPILIQLLIITYEYYNKLIIFEVRYKNRKKYLNELFKESIIKHSTLSIITFLTQFLFYYTIFNNKNPINMIIIYSFIKYTFELYLFEIIIITISILTTNYIYSYIISIIASLLIIISKKLTFLPFVTLFQSYTFNLINILVLIAFYIIIAKIYKNIDLGGVKHEINN